MTEQEKELIEYFKSVWLRTRIGIVILVCCMTLLWFLY